MSFLWMVMACGGGMTSIDPDLEPTPAAPAPAPEILPPPSPRTPEIVVPTPVEREVTNYLPDAQCSALLRDWLVFADTCAVPKEMSPWTLRILRNTGFAFRGRPFKSPELDTWFRQEDKGCEGSPWYTPDPTRTDVVLSKPEEACVAKLAVAEQNLRASLKMNPDVERYLYRKTSFHSVRQELDYFLAPADRGGLELSVLMTENAAGYGSVVTDEDGTTTEHVWRVECNPKCQVFEAG